MSQLLSQVADLFLHGAEERLYQRNVLIHTLSNTVNVSIHDLRLRSLRVSLRKVSSNVHTVLEASGKSILELINLRRHDILGPFDGMVASSNTVFDFRRGSVSVIKASENVCISLFLNGVYMIFDERLQRVLHRTLKSVDLVFHVWF